MVILSLQLALDIWSYEESNENTKWWDFELTLYIEWSFTSVNVNKSAKNCGFGHIY